METPGIEDAKFVGDIYKLRGKQKEVRNYLKTRKKGNI